MLTHYCWAPAAPPTIIKDTGGVGHCLKSVGNLTKRFKPKVIKQSSGNHPPHRNEHNTGVISIGSSTISTFPSPTSSSLHSLPACSSSNSTHTSPDFSIQSEQSVSSVRPKLVNNLVPNQFLEMHSLIFR